jgi:hypothetical protein
MKYEWMRACALAAVLNGSIALWVGLGSIVHFSELKVAP